MQYSHDLRILAAGVKISYSSKFKKNMRKKQNCENFIELIYNYALSFWRFVK